MYVVVGRQNQAAVMFRRLLIAPVCVRDQDQTAILYIHTKRHTCARNNTDIQFYITRVLDLCNQAMSRGSIVPGFSTSVSMTVPSSTSPR